jgi:hypothetical protein
MVVWWLSSQEKAMASRDPEKERHWQSVLTQWQQSEQSISAFCNQRHLSKPTFCYWQQKLGFGRRSTRPSPAATFVPMTLVAELRVEVVLPTGVTFKLPLTADKEQITRWLAAARAAAC